MARKNPSIAEYKFTIDAYSPDRMPMKFLGEYLTDLADLFGEEYHVHFNRLEMGSTVPVIHVEREALPRVRDRLHLVKLNEGPDDAQKAFKKINDRLREHNADAFLTGPDSGGKILLFPGVNEVRPPVFGPFTQFDVIEGVPIMIGGERPRVPIHLEGNEREILICYATRATAKRMARYLFTTPIRVEGNARWIRERDGEWHIKHFSVSDFHPLPEGTLADDLKRLRAIPSEWKELEDPLAELDIIRREGEIQ